MTQDDPLFAPHPVLPTELPAEARHRILLYVGVLAFMLGFGDPNEGLLNLPFSFLLKNKLHLPAHEMANFGLVSGLPLYFAFLFGFIRDTWRPFGMRDRGYMIAFGALGASLDLVFAFTPLSTFSMLVAILTLTIAFLFAAAAQNGLSSTIARQHAMSGRVAAVWSIFGMIPVVATYIAGGYFSDWLEAADTVVAQRIMFLASGAVMALVALYAVWRPGVVYDNVHHEDPIAHRPWREFKRLATHWPIYPAGIVWLLWSFNPGVATPLQYHLQNTFGASDSQWGLWNAVYWASYIPAFIAYGLLCRAVPLRRMLFWSTLVAIPQFTPLLLIHSINDALLAAVPIGLMGGLANAAFLDLLIRSCPPGLQGTLLMMSTSLYYVATRGGDVLGSYLYERAGGFSTCVVSTLVVYTLILPVLALAPRRIVETADGVFERKSRDESALSLAAGNG